MFFKRPTKPYTGASWDQIGELRRALEDAGAVITGAGAGLSASAGFTYSGERFSRYFGDFKTKYGFPDMYSGGFGPFESPEEQWAYWSRYIMINRYADPPKPVYDALRELLEGRDCFVLTTNVDHCFQKAGFDKNRLFYTQGDYGLWQCSEPCRQETYGNEEAVRRMWAEQKDMKIPSELIPRCPKCGKPMVMNLRVDHTFVQDEGWYRAAQRYEDFLHRRRRGRVLYLELGVGMNTPGIVKYSFWRQVLQNPEARYVCVNQGQSRAPREIAERSLCIDADIGAVLAELNAR